MAATVSQACQAVAAADVVVIVGTSFKVSPFNQLLAYKQAWVPVVVINREPLSLAEPHTLVLSDAATFFNQI